MGSDFKGQQGFIDPKVGNGQGGPWNPPAMPVPSQVKPAPQQNPPDTLDSFQAALEAVKKRFNVNPKP